MGLRWMKLRAELYVNGYLKILQLHQLRVKVQDLSLKDVRFEDVFFFEMSNAYIGYALPILPMAVAQGIICYIAAALLGLKITITVLYAPVCCC